MKTRVFKSGNSQAVRIPAEIAFADMDAELEITRTGDVLLIYPAPKTDLANVVEFLRSTPPPAPLGPIERTRVRETRWDRQAGTPQAQPEFADEQRIFDGPPEPDRD
jgi:antitoxin VapB